MAPTSLNLNFCRKATTPLVLHLKTFLFSRRKIVGVWLKVVMNRACFHLVRGVDITKRTVTTFLTAWYME